MSGCKRRQPKNEPRGWGLKTKIHPAVDAHGMPVRVIITDGTTADCTKASKLIDGIQAGHLLADKGYNSDHIVDRPEKKGMKDVIPSRRNRKCMWEYDRPLYALRHLVENSFLHLKRLRWITTRYAKNAASFLAAVQIRCIALWAVVLRLDYLGDGQNK